MTCNVKGLQNKNKRLKVFSYLKEKVNNRGIVFMQETHSSPEVEDSWKKEWDGDLIFSHGSSNSTGVIIGLTKNLGFSIDKITRDTHGRVVIINITADSQDYVLINFYNSNSEREQLISIKSLDECIDSHVLDDSRHAILSGDFNLVFDIDMDAHGGSPTIKTKSLSALIELLEKLDVSDIYRIRNPNKKRYTFRQKNRNNVTIHRRLDYIFLSNSLQEYANNIDILPSMLSDHSPVLLSLSDVKNHERGRGSWKFNNSLLQLQDFQTEISSIIRNSLLESDGTNPHFQWEFLKYNIRKFCVMFSKNRSKAKNNEKLNHESVVKNFESNSGDVLQTDYDTSKLWLENWYDDYTKGAILRSKAEWYEKGEKSTKYFLNLEKKNSTKNTIRNLCIGSENNTDIYTNNPNTILDHTKSFYENLFSRKSDKSLEDCFDYLNNTSTPKISLLQKLDCDRALKIEELWDSLDSMSSGKSPGNDGLTVEFYKTFWPLLKDTLYNSYMYSNEHGYLSTSQRQAIIKLLEKKDKDKRYIQNWRPISLLNVDTKIISKAIACRLRAVLPSIISHDQTAYVKGRFIGESTRLISDILDYTDTYNIGGYILTADIEKAFDSMDHTFLIACLHKFGFGSYFINWVKILLNKSESCVINGGTTSMYFQLKRGARQGDPIAAYLFIIALEIFFINVRSNSNINKLVIFDHSFLLSAYADDTTFFVKDVFSVKLILDIFGFYSDFSGFKLNLAKCEICGIGSLKGDPAVLCNIKNVNLITSSIKVLGIHFSYNQILSDSKNFVDTIEKIEGVLRVWKMRHLTLHGKVIIFKTLAISKIVFVSYISSVSDIIVMRLKDIHKKFIWDGKRPKIKHSSLIGDYDQGGLKDIDIVTKIKSLQLSWLKRLHDNNFHPWKIIPEHVFAKISPLGKNIFYPNFNLPFSVKIPSFYAKILEFWSEFSSATPITPSSMLSESIWYNSFIKIDNRVISPSFLKLKYTLHIADLLDDVGRVIPWLVFKLSKSLPDAFYFKWLQIIDALPKLWIESIQTDEGKSRQFCEFRPHLITNAKMYPIDKLTSRELYNFRVKKLYRAPTAQGSIQKFLNMNNLPWKDIYRLSRYISVDSFSRMFQYKVLNNILFLNSSLFAMGLCETSLCSFCQGEKETFHHLFSTCNVTTNVWQELTTFFSSKVCLPPLSLQSAVLGFLEDCQHHLFLNNILLMFKITVYRNRSKNIVTARNVLFNLKQRENIEKSIAFTNKKMDFHFTKWHFFHSLVDDTGTF